MNTDNRNCKEFPYNPDISQTIQKQPCYNLLNSNLNSNSQRYDCRKYSEELFQFSNNENLKMCGQKILNRKSEYLSKEITDAVQKGQNNVIMDGVLQIDCANHNLFYSDLFYDSMSLLQSNRPNIKIAFEFIYSLLGDYHNYYLAWSTKDQTIFRCKNFLEFFILKNSINYSPIIPQENLSSIPLNNSHLTSFRTFTACPPFNFDFYSNYSEIRNSNADLLKYINIENSDQRKNYFKSLLIICIDIYEKAVNHFRNEFIPPSKYFWDIFADNIIGIISEIETSDKINNLKSINEVKFLKYSNLNEYLKENIKLIEEKYEQFPQFKQFQYSFLTLFDHLTAEESNWIIEIIYLIAFTYYTFEYFMNSNSLILKLFLMYCFSVNLQYSEFDKNKIIELINFLVYKRNNIINQDINQINELYPFPILSPENHEINFAFSENFSMYKFLIISKLNDNIKFLSKEYENKMWESLIYKHQFSINPNQICSQTMLNFLDSSLKKISLLDFSNDQNKFPNDVNFLRIKENLDECLYQCGLKVDALINSKRFLKEKRTKTKAIKISEIINFLKLAHTVRQIFSKLVGIELESDKSIINYQIYMDIDKNFYLFKDLLKFGNFKFNYSGIMKYRNDICLICGLNLFLLGKIRHESDFLTSFEFVKTREAQKKFYNVCLKSDRLIEIKKNIDILLLSFIEEITDIEDLLESKYVQILKQFTSEGFKIESFNSKSIKKENNIVLVFPKPIIKFINKWRNDSIIYSASKEGIDSQSLINIKREMILKQFKTNLIINKTTRKYYLNLLNVQDLHCWNDFLKFLHPESRKRIFKIEKKHSLFFPFS